MVVPVFLYTTTNQAKLVASLSAVPVFCYLEPIGPSYIWFQRPKQLPTDVFLFLKFPSLSNLLRGLLEPFDVCRKIHMFSRRVVTRWVPCRCFCLGALPKRNTSVLYATTDAYLFVVATSNQPSNPQLCTQESPRSTQLL